jgi:hypothetical protein
MISRWIVSFIESMMKVSGPSEGGSGGGGGGGGGFTFSMEALQTPGVPHIKLKPIQYKCMPFIGIKYRGLSERNATSNNNKNLVSLSFVRFVVDLAVHFVLLLIPLSF